MLAAEIVTKDKKEQHKRVEDLLEIFNIEPIRQRKGVITSYSIHYTKLYEHLILKIFMALAIGLI